MRLLCDYFIDLPLKTRRRIRIERTFRVDDVGIVSPGFHADAKAHIIILADKAGG
nr:MULTISPECIES: hypothetical protein [Thiorhodovibrio]